MSAEAALINLKSAQDYNKEKYDTMGWDASKHYAPLEKWEYDITDRSDDTFDISKLIMDTVTSFDKQKVVILIQGKQGAGKSWLALNLLWNVALRVAYYKWKDYGRWREVYNYVTNTAIMLKEDTDWLIKHMNKEQCYLLDDVYDTLAAQEWYTQIHKAINSIMMADRTDRTITIITVPRGAWIDRIVRGIAGYRCDVKRNIGIKRRGFSQFKFVMLEWNEFSPKKGVPNTPYIKTGNTSWEDGFGIMPPMEIYDWYEPVRSVKLEALKDVKRQPIEEDGADEGIGGSVSATEFAKEYSKSHSMNGNDYTVYIDEVWDAAINAGYDIQRDTIVKALNKRKKRKKK
jgi:hypothetical protein